MIEYLAGIFDAEGYVRIRKSSVSTKGNYSYQAEVRIYMCDKRIIQKFADLYNLTVKSDFRGINRKIAYHVTIGKHLLKSTSFIEDFLPFLNEKKAQLQEVKNLLFTDKDTEKCYQDYMIAKEYFFHPTNTFLSFEYLAGIMDGDGWFTMFNASKGADSHKNTFKVGLEQRYKPMIEYMLNFGGYIQQRPIKDAVKHTQTYEWSTTNSNILYFLKQIYPFLIEKKDKCKILIDYINKYEEFKKYSILTIEKWKTM